MGTSHTRPSWAPVTRGQPVLCRLKAADVVFLCPALQHASLAYNALQSLPSDLFPSSPLLSLDLNHNNLADLDWVLSQLLLLDSLASLSLRGNPLCLQPSYAVLLRQTLTKLVYVDGQVK